MARRGVEFNERSRICGNCMNESEVIAAEEESKIKNLEEKYAEIQQRYEDLNSQYLELHTLSDPSVNSSHLSSGTNRSAESLKILN